MKGGTYNVRITKNGYEAYETQVTVADNATITINAELVPLEGIVADFTADVTAVAVGGSVHFTDNSWGAQLTNWNWEFEGGTPATSTAQNPTVTYNQAGNFGVRLTVTNADGESDTKYMPNYISAAEAYNMQNGSITTCDAMFYDDGGPNNNYGNNKDLTLTFLPAIEGGSIEVTFQTFDTEGNYDFLYIYDGPSTSSPEIGRYDGGNSPGTVTATNAQGALTFRFTSDSSVNREGWSAHVSCAGVLAPIVVTVTAEPESILTGQTSQLSAFVTGGSGVYTYHWEPAEMVSNANIANPQTVELYETQTFDLTVSDDQGNTGTGSVTVNVTSGVNVNENQADKVQVYPNPVSSTLFIDGLNGFSNLDVQIVSIQGQVIKEVVNSLEINVSNIESGIYFIKIECDGQQYLKKFIIK